MLKHFKATDGKIAGDIFTWRDISKFHIENYVGQDEVTLSLFFYSQGSSGNNKPYRYHKRISTELAVNVMQDVNRARKIDSTTIDDVDDPLKNW